MGVLDVACHGGSAASFSAANCRKSGCMENRLPSAVTSDRCTNAINNLRIERMRRLAL
ncbi:MAG: hypothetical protein R2838_15965 [Caldilineaceae bacterium]